MELTEGERTAFGQLLGLEEEAEVEGFVTIGNNFEEFKVEFQGFRFGVESRLMEEEGLYSRPRQRRVVDSEPATDATGPPGRACCAGASLVDRTGLEPVTSRV